MSAPFAALLEEAPPPQLPSRFSVSMVGSSTQCMLKMRFDREAGFGGYFATIGLAAHEIFATAEFKAQLMGATFLYPDDVEEIAYRVLRNSERPYLLDWTQQRYVVQMARTWAERTEFPADADRWVIEHPFRIPIEDPEDGVVYTLSGRMDRYAIWDDERHFEIKDWKTGPRLPTQKEVQEDHSQLPLYALAAAVEYPWLETFECAEVYARRGIPRTVYLSADDLPDLRRWLIDRCRTIVRSYREQRFEAVPSERWCNYCPKPEQCPKPELVRPASIVRSREQAEEQIKAAIVLDARSKKAKGAAKGWLEANHTMVLEVGRKEYGFHDTVKRTLNEERLAEILQLHGLKKDDLYEDVESQEYGSRVK